MGVQWIPADGFLKISLQTAFLNKFLILGCLPTHTFIFFLTSIVFWKREATVHCPPPSLLWVGKLLIKIFFFQFEFLFYAVYMTLCAIVFQCNFVKHIKSVFWKIYTFLIEIRLFLEGSEFQCWCIFRYGFEFSDYDFQNS